MRYAAMAAAIGSIIGDAVIGSFIGTGVMIGAMSVVYLAGTIAGFSKPYVFVEGLFLGSNMPFALLYFGAFGGVIFANTKIGKGEK